jgi:hypothetical protein
MEGFRSKVSSVIDKVALEVRDYLAGAGPTRSRPRVNECAIARRAKVNRTTFRASYHADLVDRIDGLKKLLRKRKSGANIQRRKRKRTQRPKQADLIEQLTLTAQALRDADRERHALAQKLRMYESARGAAGPPHDALEDEEIVELLKSRLARRKG